MRAGTRRGWKMLLAGAAAIAITVSGLGTAATGASALTDAPPVQRVTFSLAAVSAQTGAQLTEATAGVPFDYAAAVGCPDPRGCKSTSLTVTFPDEVVFSVDDFRAPTGAAHSFEPGPQGPKSGGGTLTVIWKEALASSAVLLLRSTLPQNSLATLDGATLTATGTVTNDGQALDPVQASLTARVFETPGVTWDGQSWEPAAVVAGTGTEVPAKLTSTATVNSNATSDLTFASTAAVASGVAVAEAFNLKSLSLTAASAGAASPSSVTLEFADGGSQTFDWPNSSASFEVPEQHIAEVTGYSVTVAGVPNSDAPEADRRYTLEAEYVLRDTLRSSGDPVIPDSQTSQAVLAEVTATDRVTRPAPGESATRQTGGNRSISVTREPIKLTSSLLLETASGDATSNYESGAAATLTLTAANAGTPGLTQLGVTLPQSKGDYFNYESLASAPTVRFPAGAASATIRYSYVNPTPGAGESATQQGAELAFGLGDPVPGPDAEPSASDPASAFMTLDRVSQIELVFHAADGSLMPGNCDLTAECAAEVIVQTTLRDEHLTTGKPIVPGSGSSGNTVVTVVGDLTAEGSRGSTFETATENATLTIEKPRLDLVLSKQFGNPDGSDRTVYPPTGVAHAGDYYDGSGGTQHFTSHPLRFTASSKPQKGHEKDSGPREFVISDPQITPQADKLSATPFNVIEFTSISAQPAVCVTGDKKAVASKTAREVWVLRNNDAGKKDVTLIPFEDLEAADYTNVMGIRISITPEERTFPADVSCTIPGNTAVQFRDARLSDGEAVSPATIANPTTPGLMSLGNTAELTTGKNFGTTTGTDSLYLVDRQRASMYKHFDEGASVRGIEGERTPTAFLLAGVPAGENSVSTTITDGRMSGGKIAAAESFDLLELTGVRDAQIGPDQDLEVVLAGVNGAPLATGTVKATRKLGDRDLSDEEVADSQSSGYQKFRLEKRKIEWDAPLEALDLPRVGSVSATITRSDAKAELQRYGGFSLVVDARLRDTLLTDSKVPVRGSNSGAKWCEGSCPTEDFYANIASVRSLDASGVEVQQVSSRLDFPVFAATQAFVETNAEWRENRATADPVLVAQDATPALLTLNAYNSTAVGAPNVQPQEQWRSPSSIGIGLESLSVAVGLTEDGTVDTVSNPFALTEFAGVEDLTWPFRTNAPAKDSDQDRKVAATITYTYADGNTTEIEAPVGTDKSKLNPPTDKWAQVRAVSVTWRENDKFVAAARLVNNRADNIGTLKLGTSLRSTIPSDMSYTFAQGDPLELQPGQGIDGVDGSISPDSVQRAAFKTVAHGIVGQAAPATVAKISNLVTIETQRISVLASNTGSVGAIYRDTAPRASGASTIWRISAQNTSNIPLESTWIASDPRLLDPSTWPNAPIADAIPAPGSTFDSFNVTGAKLTLPTGAGTAQVWALYADGTWSDPIAVTAAQSVTAPGGAVPLAVPGALPGQGWEHVVGLRAQFFAADSPLQRISKQSTGTLALDLKLRTSPRSNPSEIAPTTALPENQAQWDFELQTGAAAQRTLSVLPQVPSETSTSTIAKFRVLPGAPAPSIGKYTAALSATVPEGRLPKSVEGHPGDWSNFYLLLRNGANATSDLYNLEITDTLPAELSYNEANGPKTAWSVVSSPGKTPIGMTEREFSEPEFVVDPENPKRLTWKWDAAETLRPGEYVLLRLPVFVQDGLPPGTFATNTVRTVGSGVAGTEPGVSACNADTPTTSTTCNSTATVRLLRDDAVRAESYLNAAALGALDDKHKPCDASTRADWNDGTWVRSPCAANFTAGSTMTYRLKLINSGNAALDQLRFVDELPKVGDQWTVVNDERHSAWTPELRPNSLRLITGAAAEALGARGDASLPADGIRFTDSARPCDLADAKAGKDTLACNGNTADWTGAGSKQSKALGANVQLPAGKPLQGGEFVVVEFEMTVPTTGASPLTAWNSLAVTGRANEAALWLPAAESSPLGARAEDTVVTLNLEFEKTPITAWHLLSPEFAPTLECIPPGVEWSDATVASFRQEVSFTGKYAAGGTLTQTVRGVPLGGSCRVQTQRYEPLSPTAAGQYGVATLGADGSVNTSGYSFKVNPSVLTTRAEKNEEENENEELNEITVTNSFAEAPVMIGVHAVGDATSFLTPDTRFEVAASCEFGGITKYVSPEGLSDDASSRLLLGSGEEFAVTGLPVGATCGVTETDDLGASGVTATVNDTPAELSAERGLSLAEIPTELQNVQFENRFEAGGALTVLKQVDRPELATALSDIAFDVSCSLGGYPLELGDQARIEHSFAPGEVSARKSVTGLPIGAVCTVSEVESGGATVPAPDRTVTILRDTEVTVEMLNTFSPAELQLSKRVTGPGAAESRVPGAFDLRAVCTREVTVSGETLTVTDADVLSRVVPGTPTSITGLPEGGTCEVTEPRLAGAESVTFASLSDGVENLSTARDSARVQLLAPDAAGTLRPTLVEANNHYAATEKIGATGGQPAMMAALAGLALLLLGGATFGALRLRRR